RGAESDVDRLGDWRLVAGLALGIFAGNAVLWGVWKERGRRGLACVIRRLRRVRGRPGLACMTRRLRRGRGRRGLVRGAIVFLLIVPLALFGVVLRTNYVWDHVPAATAVCVLFAAIAVLSFATYRNELAKVALAIVLVVWLGFSNSDPYKMRYP